MPTIEAHGMGAAPPKGWDAQIYVRDDVAGPPPGAGALAAEDVRREVARPVAHLANFPLPPGRADMGGGAVELMGSGGIFIALVEFDPSEAGVGVFAPDAPPWPLSVDDFGPEFLQRSFGGQSGCQRFFTANGRPFSLYVVLGSHAQRALLVPAVNEALASVSFG